MRREDPLPRGCPRFAVYKTPSRFCLRTAPSTTALHRCDCAAGWFTVLVSNFIPQRGSRARTLRRGARKLAGSIRVRPIGEAGLPAGPPGGPSEAERIKEQELLEALDARGKLTAVERRWRPNFRWGRPIGCSSSWRSGATWRSRSSTASYCTPSGGARSMRTLLWAVGGFEGLWNAWLGVGRGI
jgi:hypothetical protein